MKDPKPVDSKTAHQLFVCGQVMKILGMYQRHEHVDPGALDAMLNQVDVNILQKYLDSKPAGFRYADECWHVIKLAQDKKASN